MPHIRLIPTPDEPIEDPIAEKLDEIMEAIDKVAHTQELQYQHSRDSVLLSLVERQADKYKKFSQLTKRIIRNVIANEPFNGRCPCCLTRDVLSEGRTADCCQFDHFYGPSLNRPELAWLICGRCHNDLDLSPKMRLSSSVTLNFQHFQSHVLDFLAKQRVGFQLPLP
jgi:hypothetical protein